MSSTDTAHLKFEESNKGVVLIELKSASLQKDTKYSWFVCACAFMTQVFVNGVMNAYGVFFVEFIKEFDSTKGQTAWIGSLAYGLSMTFGPVNSILIGRLGNSVVMVSGGAICAVSLVVSSFVTSLNVMFATFSLLYGIGACMCTAPTMTITPEYFEKYLGIATGITVSGGSFGTLIMSPLSQVIIVKAGWRTAFRVYAGLFVINMILNSRIRAPAYLKGRRIEGRSLRQDLRIWKNRVFVVWTVAIALVMFGFYIPYVHLVSYAIDQGISAETASTLMMVLGATTAVGRILFGKIVASGVLNRLHMHQLSMVVTGIGVMLLPLLKSYVGIVVYVVVVGLVDGCYGVLLPILTTHLVGLENSVLAWGFLIGTSSVTFTLGPPTAGALYDLTGSYNVSFHCAGVPILTGAALLFLIPWAQRTSKGTTVISIELKEIQNTIRIANSLDPDETPRSVASHLDPNCLQKPSKSGSSTQRASGVSDQTCPAASIVIMEASRPEATESVPVHAHHEAVSTAGSFAVSSAGNSTVSSYVGASDKATSAEDISLSSRLDDVLSHLGSNTHQFEEKLRRSVDSHAGSIATGFVASPEISKISPPSSIPRKYERNEGQWCTSTNSDGSRQGGRDRLHEDAEMPIGGSFQLLTKMTSASSADSYEYLNGHLQSSEVFSPTSNMPLPFSLPDNNASDGHTRENLQNTSRTNAASGEISVSGSPQRSEPVQQHAHFNQVVTEHVDILRDTMRSPTHCSCNAAVYFDEMTSASGYRGSVSPAIKINQSIKRHTEIRVSNFSPVSQGSASSGESHLSKSSFDIVTQVAIIEAACRMSADIEQGALGTYLSPLTRNSRPRTS